MKKCAKCGKVATTLTNGYAERLCSACFRKEHPLYAPLKRALKANQVYMTVHSVSRSNLSRKISAYIVVNGRLICLNHELGRIFGDRIDKNNGQVIISGCGMDMLFEAANRLWRFVMPQTEMKQMGYQQV